MFKIILSIFLLSYTSLTMVTSSYKDVCNIVSFSGGGSFGAVELGILESLLEKKILNDNVDIITGISAGGLNAGFLSKYNSLKKGVNELKDIVFNLTTDNIYKKSYHIFNNWALYDTKPLEDTLRNKLEVYKFIYFKNDGPKVLIGSTNLNKEKLEIHHYHNDLHIDKKIDILMATSAIPFIFKPRKIGNYIHIDGGVISNELILQALYYRKCSNYNIYLINSNNKNFTYNNIDGLTTYMKSVIKLLYHTFDNSLSRLNTDCLFSNKKLFYIYPNSTLLDNYSILNFNHGFELFNIGKNNYVIDHYNIC